MLFEPPIRFQGLPREGFDVFRVSDREARRLAIVKTIHPALEELGKDLLERLGPKASVPLHVHLPRLDWPRGYQPFATWLAISAESHGYQASAQLNVGVHRDQVALRIGWDTAADAFGRFEFLCRHGEAGAELVRAAEQQGLRIRVYVAAPWPEGSTCVFESSSDLATSLDEARRRGVWWEVGRRYTLPEALDHVTSAELGREACELFARLLPIWERFVVQHKN